MLNPSSALTQSSIVFKENIYRVESQTGKEVWSCVQIPISGPNTLVLKSLLEASNLICFFKGRQKNEVYVHGHPS